MTKDEKIANAIRNSPDKSVTRYSPETSNIQWNDAEKPPKKSGEYLALWIDGMMGVCRFYRNTGWQARLRIAGWAEIEHEQEAVRVLLED